MLNINNLTGGQRILWLDASRGLAFLMVIYSHLIWCDEALMRYFSPVFLTTFFFVSGYLYKDRMSFREVFIQRTRSLLVPLFVLGLIMIGMNFVLSFNEYVPLADRIKGLLFQNGDNEILWFIAALYVYSLAFWPMLHCITSSYSLLLIALSFFVLNTVYLYWLGWTELPWHITLSGFGCFYMALGKLYRRYETQVDRLLSTGWVLPLILIIYLSFITLTRHHYSFTGSRWCIDALIVTILGLGIMVRLSKGILSRSRLLLFVGANSLFYFAFHGKAFSLLTVIFSNMMSAMSLSHSHAIDLILCALIVILDALILILPAMLMSRYLPWAVGKKIKNK